MKIVKVVPTEDFTVFVHYENKTVKLFDASILLDKYQILKDKTFFIERCTIMNDTLAWDVSGTMDDTVCIDIAPEALEDLDSIL